MTNGTQQTYDFETTARRWHELMMDNYTVLTRNFVGSEAFAAASSAWLDWTLAYQKKMRDNLGQYMESLDVPRRSDLARLSKQIHSTETRVADCEEAIDSLRESVERGLSDLAKQLAALNARLASRPEHQTTEKSSTSRRKTK